MKFNRIAQERASVSLATSIALLLLCTTLGSFKLKCYAQQKQRTPTLRTTCISL